MSEPRIMYNISYIARNGLRTLLGPAQGRCMHATREASEGELVALLRNSEARLVEIHGEQSRGTFRVDAFECYDHGDPKSIYVNEGEV